MMSLVDEWAAHSFMGLPLLFSNNFGPEKTLFFTELK